MIKEEIELQHNIVVDLDVLFDTRLPIVYAIDEETAKKEVELDKYHSRFKDVFGIISNDIFKALYGNRDKNVLVLAAPTGMFKILGDYCVETRGIKNSTSDDEFLVVYINTYPYDLNLNEQKNIVSIMESMIPNTIFKTIYSSIPEMTPKWVSEHVGTIMKYDAINWLEYHTAVGNLVRTPLLNTNLIGPAIVTGDIKSKDVTEQTFSELMNKAASLISTTLIRAKYFSLIKEKKKDK